MSNKSNTRQQIKRILRESAVIVFSVLLALFANEWRSNVKEAQQTQTILNNIKLELKDNERIAQKAIQYHQSVYQNLEAVVDSDTIEQFLFDGYIFEDYKVAPNGIMREGFNNIAWIVAKEERLATRISFQQSEALYEAYDQQLTVEETLNKVTNLVYDRQTHRRTATKENVVLLILIFHELVAQEEELLRRYQLAWERLENTEE